NTGFTNMTFTDTIDGVLTSDTLTGLYNDTYYWRVRAIDDLGNQGPYSDTRGFVTDTIVNQVALSYPTDGHETTAINILVGWTANADSVGVDSYTIEVAKNLTFVNMVFTDTLDQLLTSDTITGLYNDSYYWRVRAVDGLGNSGAYSTARGFVTDTIAAQVSLTAPADGHETTASQPVASWSAATDSVGVDSYAMEVSRTSGFAAFVFADTIDGVMTSDTITGLYNDSYYWRVRAIDDLGNVGTNSAVRGFLTDTDVDTVDITTPLGSVVINTTLEVEWAPLADSSGIDSYVLDISNQDSFAVLYSSDTRDGTETSFLKNNLVSDTYFIRMHAIDNLVTRGAYTIKSFVLVDTMTRVTLISPDTSHETNAVQIDFKWGTQDNTETYTWQISKTAAFSVISDSVVDTSATSLRYSLPDEDTFYWRILGQDAAGNEDTSEPRWILLDTRVLQTTAAAPPNGHETTQTAVVVSWLKIASDSVGLDSYVLEASNTSGFIQFVFADTLDAAITQDTITGLYNDSYHWRVRGIDHLGNAGPNSAARGFVTDTLVNAVTLSTPADGHETTAVVVVATWLAVSDSVGVDSYAIEVSRTAGFTTFVFTDTIDGLLTSDTITGLYNDSYYWRVRAIDNLGNPGAFGSARGFVVTDTLVNGVTVTAPVDGHETTVIAVVASWEAVLDSVGIDSYAIESSRTSDFGVLVFSDTLDGLLTSDTITGLYNDSYYWRVRAIDNLGNRGSFGTARGFVTDTIVDAVTLSYPSTGHETTAINILAGWTAVSDSVGVDSYAVEVAKNLTFVNMVFTDTLDRLLTSDTITGLYNDSYYWRVRAIDDLGNQGPYSDTRGFVTDTIVNTVTLVYPSDGHETTAINFLVGWTSSDSVGIDTYAVDVAKNTAFTNLVFTDTLDALLTSDTITGLYNDSYYWRVRSIDNLGNQGTFGPARGFVTDTIVYAVTLVYPSDGHETTAINFLVGWTTSDSVGIDTYAVEVSKNTAFTNLTFTDTIDGVLTSDTLTGLYNDTYYWRVRAIDDLGNQGSFGAARGFVTDTLVAQVTVVSPADGHETTNAKPVVVWSAVAADSVGIDSYVVEVSNQSNFGTFVFADTVDQALAQDTVTGLYNDTYYWRVRAVDDLGNAGPNSSARGYVIDTIVTTVTLSYPSDGHETTAINFLVGWTTSDSVGVDTYAVEVAKNTAFTNLVFTDTLDALLTSDTIPGLYNDSYYWRIRAIDNLGNQGTFATARGFLTDTLVDSVTVISPLDQAQISSTLNLQWQALADSSGVDSYAIEISTTSAFTTLFSSDTVAGSDTTFTKTDFLSDTYFLRIRAIDNLDNRGTYTIISFGLTDTSTKVKLVSPDTGHETRAVTVEFQWGTQDNTETFTWQISRSPSFETFTDSVVDTTATSFKFSLPSEDTFYWRVSGVDQAGNRDTSASRWIFLDTRVSNVTILSPADAGETSNAGLTVTWAAVTSDSVGIDSYRVEVSNTSSFTIFTFVDTVAASITQSALTGLYNDTYFWRVLAIDHVGNTSPVPEVRSFLVDTSVETVTPVSPADGHETTAFSFVVTWQAVSSDSTEIDSYTVDVSTTSAFTTTVFSDTVDSPVTQDTITAPCNDTYFWRVRGVDRLGNRSAAWTARTFRVDTMASSVVLAAPAGGHETTQIQIVVAWNLVTDDSSGIDSYVIEVSNAASFTIFVFADTVSHPNASDTVTGLYNDTYFWRVRSVDRLGNVGSAASSRSFVVDTVTGRVVLSLPANGSSTVETAPNLSWLATADSVGIDTYAMEVSNAPDFSTLNFSDSVAGTLTDRTVSPGLAGDTYYWRVRAIDRLGNQGPYSDSYSFYVDTSTQPNPGIDAETFTTIPASTPAATSGFTLDTDGLPETFLIKLSVRNVGNVSLRISPDSTDLAIRNASGENIASQFNLISRTDTFTLGASADTTILYEATVPGSGAGVGAVVIVLAESRPLSVVTSTLQAVADTRGAETATVYLKQSTAGQTQITSGGISVGSLSSFPANTVISIVSVNFLSDTSKTSVTAANNNISAIATQIREIAGSRLDQSVTEINVSNQPAADIQITIPYDPAGLTADQETTLKVFTLNETVNPPVWEVLSGSQTVNAAGNTVTAATPHFSIFRIFSVGPGILNSLGSGVIVFPNPFKPNDGDDQTGTSGSGIYFGIKSGNGAAGFPKGATLEIFNVLGTHLTKAEVTTDAGGILNWDVTNRGGQRVASGVYVYLIRLPNGERAVGKFSIIR
ncbi:hypothetical protein HY522_12375, partial [bacterium]|nr:hypothetical protein [bacterium]